MTDRESSDVERDIDPAMVGYRGDGNLMHRIARQRRELASLQAMFDRSNQQKRYLAQAERTRKAREEARMYRHKLYDFADALARIAEDDGTHHATIARDALNKESWLGR
jgi:hypothetical protein